MNLDRVGLASATSPAMGSACRLSLNTHKWPHPSPQATVVAMEGAAARWQAQAGEVEQGLALLRFRCAKTMAAGCSELQMLLLLLVGRAQCDVAPHLLHTPASPPCPPLAGWRTCCPR